MGKRTGVIRYNLLDTGRDFTGQPRKLDIPAAMRLFNGPAMQEAIRKGDIVGYYGHQFREKFGLDVPETVIVDGKQVTLEPCVKTVLARCLPDGTLEHEQEFMDTPAGRIAERLWEGKSYGFSSAIHAPEMAGLRVPMGYFGMDFVRAPNYDKNRGYMLDSVGPGCFTEGDEAVAETAALYDSVDAMIRESDARVRDSDEQARQISEAYLAQIAANDALLDECAKLQERLKQAGVGGAMLDHAGTAPDVMQRPMVVSKGQDMLDSAKLFMAADLPPLPEEAPAASEVKAAEEEKAQAGFIQRTIGLVDRVLGGA